MNEQIIDPFQEHQDFVKKRQATGEKLDLFKQTNQAGIGSEISKEKPQNEQHSLDEVLLKLYDQTVSGELGPIMTTRISNNEKFSETLRTQDSLKNFSPEYINAAEQKNLTELETAIKEADDLPPFAQKMYLEKLRLAKLNVELQEKRGTKEFTQLQYTPEQWGQFIDVEKTEQSGETTLLAETEAKALLEQTSNESLPFKNAREFAAKMNFTENEMKDLGIPDSDWENEQIVFNSQQQKNIMQLYLERLGITGWEIELTKVANISINSLMKKIRIPQNGEKDLLAFVIGAHEVATHVYRSEKGARQKFAIWKHGEPGYEESEEGLATFMEYLMGEPFGHSRQKEFAARYYAIAMALKTKNNEQGEKVAKYSPQEIYQQLRDYQVSEKSATSIVWRLLRGTSCQQQIVDIDVKQNDKNTTLQIPECFAKDHIYFAGMQGVFTWIKKILPYLSVLHSLPNAEQRLGQTLEINDYYLKLLGYSYARLVKNKTPGMLSQDKENQVNLTDYGRDFLLNVYEFFCQMGKVSMGTILDPEIRALVLPNPNDNLSIKKLFQPCK